MLRRRPPRQPAALPPPPAHAAPRRRRPRRAADVPMVPAGQVALMVSARFGRDPPNITGGLHWRIYPDKPDARRRLPRCCKEERAAAPIFVLPPGGYVVHVEFRARDRGQEACSCAPKPCARRSRSRPAARASRAASATAGSRRARSRSTSSAAASSKAASKRPIASNVAASDVVLLPEGTYHVVSNYGDSNATVRSDIRVQAGKLTDVVVNHRAAVITLKLVERERRRGARQYPVVGADPRRRRREGGDRRISQGDTGGRRIFGRRPNEGKIFNGKFKVEPGVDREIEVIGPLVPRGRLVSAAVAA